MVFFRIALIFLLLLPSLAFGEIVPSQERITWQPGYTFNGGKPAFSGTINVMDYGCAADGVTDDMSCIDSAISAASDGQNVYFPAGTYKITGDIDVNKDIRLVGDGATSTTITSSARSGHIIDIRGSSSGGTTTLTSDAVKGALTISVSSSSGFAVGDLVLVSQRNDPDLVFAVGSGGTWCGSSGDYTMNQMNRIKAINGNTITLQRENFWSWETALGARMVRQATSSGAITAGVEDMRIVRTETGGGDANSEAHINFQMAYKPFVVNVHTDNPNGSHIRFRNTLMGEVRGSFLDRAMSVDSGRGYGVNMFDENSDLYVVNNIATHLRHSFITECGGSGIVVAYNYSDNPVGNIGDRTLFADFSHHGIHAFMNLWEGNWGSHFSPDNTHGSGSHNTALRNIFTGYSDPDNESTINGARRAVEIHEKNYYTHVVGNILGTDLYDGSWDYYQDGSSRNWSDIYVISWGYGSDGDSSRNGTVAESTGIDHGNFNHYEDDIRWDSGIADHTIPNSYYLSFAPSFFRDNGYAWPWVTPDEATRSTYLLPAKERWDAGTYFTEVSHGPPNPPPAAPMNLIIVPQ